MHANKQAVASLTSDNEGAAPRLPTSLANISTVTGSLRTRGFANPRCSPASVARTSGDAETGWWSASC